MKQTIKFEALVSIKGIEKILDIKIPDDVSSQNNVYDAYAAGYHQAFNDLAQEMTGTFSYGANNVNQIIEILNDKNRSKIDGK